MQNERPDPVASSVVSQSPIQINDIKFTSPIVVKVFFLLLIFNIVNDMLSDLINTNKIIFIKEYYGYSLKNLVDKNKVDLFVKATSDLTEEISRINRFILERNVLASIIGTIEFFLKAVILYVFSFFLTKFFIRNR